jgi:membrane associated rhomboid family serine protease
MLKPIPLLKFALVWQMALRGKPCDFNTGVLWYDIGVAYDSTSEYRRQTEQHYRLGMQGGWTQGALWTRRFLAILLILWLIALLGPRLIPAIAPFIVGLYLQPSEVATGKFWQIFTSPWLGATSPCQWTAFLFHLLYLLTFGPKVEREWGNARFLRFYLITAFIASAIAFLLRLPSSALTLFPASTASAAIFAVMIAYVSMWPRDMFYVFGLFPTPILYCVLAICGIEAIYMILNGASPLGVDFVASIAGATLGFAAMKIPFIYKLFLGSKKSKVSTAGKRAGKYEFKPGGQSSGGSTRTPETKQAPIVPPSVTTETQSQKNAKKDGKRSGFLEM